jgi:hypothetical protein
MIQSNQGFTSMIVRMQTGLTAEGKPSYKDKSYPRILPSVTQDDLYAVGEALMSLSAYRIHHIQRLDREEMVRLP